MKLKKILIRICIILMSILAILYVVFQLVRNGVDQVDWQGVADEYITQNEKYKITIEYGYQNLDMVSYNIKIITHRLSDNKKVIVTETKAYNLIFKFTEYENGDVNILNDNQKGSDYNYEINWSEIYK